MQKERYRLYIGGPLDGLYDYRFESEREIVYAEVKSGIRDFAYLPTEFVFFYKDQTKGCYLRLCFVESNTLLEDAFKKAKSYEEARQ